MSTLQSLIRQSIKARIEAAMPGVPVHLSPRWSIPDSGIPCIGIFSKSDRPANEEDDHQKAHRRIYTLRIECIATGRPEEDATDDLAMAVRKAVLTDDSLQDPGSQPLTFAITWAGQDWDGEEGDPLEAKTGLEFDCIYLWRPE